MNLDVRNVTKFRKKCCHLKVKRKRSIVQFVVVDQKILSLGSFHLKGSGWYKDGYGKRDTSKEEVAKPATQTETKEPPKAKPIADD